MKMSKEDRARVFALYMGSCIKYPPFDNPEYGRVKLGAASYYDFVNGSMTAKLILKDLSEISDEDAVEVARILKVSYSNNPESDACFDITGLAFFLQELFETGSDVMSVTGDKILLLSDFIRSRSYMLPYKGINLFQSGIAIKEKK